MNKEHRSHLSNLIALAHADGEIVKNEMELLSSIGKLMGISKEEIQDQIENQQEFEFVMPISTIERYNQLYDLITMIMIDGNIHKQEVSLLKKYAHKLGFSEIMVDTVAEKIREYLANGFSANKISKELPDLISKF